ncbi:hypothetical protein P7H22_18035 [Paenibacillus larvae]|nr:hypothetical protein [Paenibacillus larvae]MDT2241846.1 hypothetical protein [Paenibacillus larvae]
MMRPTRWSGIRTMLSDSGASIVPTVSAVFAGSDEMYRGIVAGTSVEHIVYLTG